ncbi:MAG: release factor glutamine methyltransferase [Candidatus Woesearchaeota archaeon]|jgi:release factor glutamine methyltransferase
MDYYEPEEDSYLIQSIIESLAYTPKTILDMGTGSGILAHTAQNKFPKAKVTAVDINPKALIAAKESDTSNKINFVNSDRFSKVKSTFDLIISNPPYLPENKFDKDDMFNKALVGGKKGYEWIFKFLEEAKKHLAPNGHIILLFSNLSNKNMIDVFLKENLYAYTCVKKKNVGLMEELYIYDITLIPHIAILLNKGYTDISYLSKGKRSIVLQATLKKKEVIKVATEFVINTEEVWLKKVNKLGIGSTFLWRHEDMICMDYCPGIRIDAAFEKYPKQKSIIISEVLRQLHILDTNSIQKAEMLRPSKHILVTVKTKPQITFLDFERCTLNERPKNVTQFVQFLARYHHDVFKEYNEEIIKEASKAYKDSKDLNIITKIIK